MRNSERKSHIQIMTDRERARNAGEVKATVRMKEKSTSESEMKREKSKSEKL